MDTQACIPPEIVALHNFICRNVPEEIDDLNRVGLELDPGGDVGILALGLPGTVACREAQDRCSEVSRLMWAQYQATLENRA